MDFLDLEVNKEVYVFNKAEKTVAKALILSTKDFVVVGLDDKPMLDNIYREVELLIYESKGKYLPGFGLSDRGESIVLSINNFDTSYNELFNKEYEIYDFYYSFEDFKKNIDGIVKDFEVARIDSLQKNFEQDKRDIEKQAVELKTKLLKIGERNGKFKRK